MNERTLPVSQKQRCPSFVTKIGKHKLGDVNVDKKVGGGGDVQGQLEPTGARMDRFKEEEKLTW